MKKLLLIFLFLPIFGSAQNLVPNPSFEQFDTCPMSSASTTWNGPTGWIINVNSADYYNVCANQASGVSVPYNAAGYQYAGNGNGYCGFYGFVRIITTQQDAREYIGCQLSSPLIIGQKYNVTFKYSLTNTSNCAINKLGILFFNNNYFGNTVFIQQPPPLINNFAHVYSDSLITDTLGWTVIRGNFIADSSYQYMIMGNFFDSANFDSILYAGSKCVAYYYIDEICVSADSLTCDLVSDVKDQYLEKIINIYPNPVKDILYIKTEVDVQIRIEIYNILGNKVYEDEITRHSTIDLSSRPDGVYFLRLIQDDKATVQKIIITH